MSETDCTQILEQIEIYLDQELDDQRRCEQIKRHIELCPPCMDRVEFRVGLKALIEDKCAGEAVPSSVQSRITEAIRAED